MRRMKTIYEMFSPELNVKDKLDEANIIIPSTFRFSNINIVIGKNGAGKTRFLRTLKELYINSVELLYGYFPGLSDRWCQRTVELPEHELREFLDQPEVSFDDFFKEIEIQSAEFLVRLMEYHSLSQKETNEKLLEKINDFFYPITGKRLIVSPNTPPDVVSLGSSWRAVPPLKEFAVQELNGEMTDLAVAMERFSPGERLLLYMAIFFALKRNSIQERVIILDEPEIHLHPQALLAFISTLKNHFPHTTVWIATHSLLLLPEFRFENIVYMEDGAVIPRDSGLYETVLSALLGDGNKEIHQFFSSIPYWQYVEFITECFASPEVVDIVDPKDEQVCLFVKALEEKRIRRVLDCGGGSGRLGLSLQAAHFPIDAYEIYDSRPSYNGDEFPVYTSLKDIKKTYDCVVMMNFLHEVEPDKWPGLFQEMYNLIESNGSLLFVEVAALKNGEWPNEAGYMVLGKDELATLFSIEGNLPEIRIRNKQKSIGVLIPRQLLKNVTTRTVFTSIRKLENRTYAELKQIRSDVAKWKKDGSVKPPNARYYAFLSQQYINAKLFSDIVCPNQLRNWFEMAKNSDQLVQMFKSASKLIIEDPMVDPELSGGTRSIFKSTVNFYRKHGRITDAQTSRCIEYIQKIEAKGAQEQTIDTFSVLLALMGGKETAQHLDIYAIDPPYSMDVSQNQ